jgi:hypothetical protein
MRGKRVKALRQIATNQYVSALMKQPEGAPLPPARLLVQHPSNPRQAINHPHTLRALYRLTKKSWKQFTRNPTRVVHA